MVIIEPVGPEYCFKGWIPCAANGAVLGWCAVRLNTLKPRQNGRHFADDIFKWIFLNENVWIPIKISLKFVPQGPINNIPTLVQIMAWHRPCDMPLSRPMMVRLPMYICINRPQWVNSHGINTKSLRPSDTYMRQWTRSSLDEVMSCRLFGAKPWTQWVLTNCKLDPREHI